MSNPPLAQLAEAMNLKFIQSEFESLKGDHPLYKEPQWKIYGPYDRQNDYRLHVIAYDGTERITISYPKFIIECKLKRILNKYEEVHHKNNKLSDNRIDNFEVLIGHEHRTAHGGKWNREEIFKCYRCGKEVIIKGESLRRLYMERKRGKSKKGPFCSKQCLGNGK